MKEVDELGVALRDALQGAAQEMHMPAGLVERLVAEVPAGTGTGRGGWRRGWTRPAVAAAAVVAVVAGVTAVVADHRRTAAPAERVAVVPWDSLGQRSIHLVGVPAPALVQPVPTVGAPKGLRACTNTDLLLAGSRSEVGEETDQSVLTTYRLVSTATSACSVSAYGITAVLVDAAGTALPQDVPLASGGVRTPSELLVKPGQFVTASVAWSVVKAEAPHAVAIALLPNDLTDGHPVTPLSIPIADVAPPPNPPAPASGRFNGRWRAGWSSSPPSVQDPAALNSLVVKVTAPARVTSGEVVHAQVRLTNETSETVSLRPCPQLQVTLDVVPLKASYVTGSRGPLNCAQSPGRISPGRSATFAVQVPTAGDPAGPGRLTFSLVVDDHAVLQGTTNLTVTASN
jgi:hypothetical protein